MQSEVYIKKIGFETQNSVCVRYALILNGHLITSFKRLHPARLAASRLFGALTFMFVEPSKFPVYE